MRGSPGGTAHRLDSWWPEEERAGAAVALLCAALVAVAAACLVCCQRRRLPRPAQPEEAEQAPLTEPAGVGSSA